MKKLDKTEQARLIYSAERMIRQRIFTAQTSHLVRRGKNRSFGELSLHQVNAATMILAKGPIFMTDLAVLLGVTPPSVSSLVDRLVKKGIILREHSNEDRRKVVVKIAPKAIAGLQELEEAALQTFIMRLIEEIGPKVTSEWCRVLQRVTEALEKLNDNS